MSRRRGRGVGLRGRDDRVDVGTDGDGDGRVVAQLDQTWSLIRTLRFEVVRVVLRELVHAPVAAEADPHAVGGTVAAVCPVDVLGDELGYEHPSVVCRSHWVPLGRCA